MLRGLALPSPVRLGLQAPWGSSWLLPSLHCAVAACGTSGDCNDPVSCIQRRHGTETAAAATCPIASRCLRSQPRSQAARAQPVARRLCMAAGTGRALQCRTRLPGEPPLRLISAASASMVRVCRTASSTALPSSCAPRRLLAAGQAWAVPCSTQPDCSLCSCGRAASRQAGGRLMGRAKQAAELAAGLCGPPQHPATKCSGWPPGAGWQAGAGCLTRHPHAPARMPGRPTRWSRPAPPPRAATTPCAAAPPACLCAGGRAVPGASQGMLGGQTVVGSVLRGPAAEQHRHDLVQLL